MKCHQLVWSYMQEKDTERTNGCDIHASMGAVTGPERASRFCRTRRVSTLKWKASQVYISWCHTGRFTEVAEDGFDPSTSGLWAQHASAAPLCSHVPLSSPDLYILPELKCYIVHLVIDFQQNTPSYWRNPALGHPLLPSLHPSTLEHLRSHSDIAKGTTSLQRAKVQT